MKIEITSQEDKQKHRQNIERRDRMESNITIARLKFLLLLFITLGFIGFTFSQIISQNYLGLFLGLILLLSVLRFLFSPLNPGNQLGIYKEELYLVEKSIKEQEEGFLKEFLQKKNFDEKFVEEIREKFTLQFE